MFKRLNKCIPVVAILMAVAVAILAIIAVYMHNREDAVIYEAKMESMPALQILLERCDRDPYHELTTHAECVKAEYLNETF